MNMIIQTRAVLSRVARQVPVAGAQLIDLVYQLDRILDCSRARVRAKVPRFVFFLLAGKENSRKIFPESHSDVRICLIVPQHGVVLRPMFFDQITFQYQRLQFGIRHNILKPRNLFYHLRFFNTLIMAWLKILVHPLAQTDRLANVDNGITAVMHNINSRLIREFFKFFFNYKHYCSS